MTWRTNLGFRPETCQILEMTHHFLCHCFHHSASEADHMIQEYFRQYGEFADESFVTHELGWRMTMQIECTIGCGNDRSDVMEWERSRGFWNPPAYAVEYEAKNYWHQFRR
jgi:hypothetical protein